VADESARASTARRRRRAGLAAIVALGLGWVMIMQSVGWAQTSYFAFVKALADGTAQIDDYHWETRDKSYTNGHFFSVKAPGLPVLLTPAYVVLDALGMDDVAKDAAANAREGGATQWYYRGLNVHAYGDDPARAETIKRRLERQAPQVWALGLLGSVLPALLLLVLIRRRVERFEPGMGTVTAVTLGMSTLLMPFAVQLFGHVLAALLSFAAFLVVWRERERAEGPSLALLAAAGLLSGLAVFTEYPLAIAGAIVGVYALLGHGARAAGWLAMARRAGAYAAGVVVGVVPLLLYNLWAFGSVTTLSYANAVNEQGTTGHETLGLNDGGFFGVMAPRLRTAGELLISPRGLLVLTPVLIMAAIGVWLLYRKGRKAEAVVITAVSLAYYLYDTGYWLPFGGGTPGPRFLVPLLPFLALGLATAWRRFPAPTLALAVPSATSMIAATISYPLVGTGGTHQWMYRIEHDNFQHTIFSIMGLDNGWWATLPVLLAFLAAAWLTARATPALDFRRHMLAAWGALAAWGLLAIVIGPAFGEEQIGGRLTAPTGFIDHRGHDSLAVVGLVAGAIALLLALWRSRPSAELVDDQRTVDDPGDPEPDDGALTPVLPQGAVGDGAVQDDGAYAEPAQPRH